MQKTEENLMEKIVSLSKRRGFIYPGSEIYGGLAGTWDWGPYGLALKNNIKNIWWRMFVDGWEDMYGIDAAIIMNPKAWESSGHVGGFSDPLLTCSKCKHSYRADDFENMLTDEGGLDRMKEIIKEGLSKNDDELFDSHRKEVYWICKNCGTKNRAPEPKQFNLMFETRVGAGDAAIKSYLRPETAGGIFVNFKNIVDSFHPKLPFGIAQIGKAFRNEIAPRDFIFRVRELEQMEIEYFIKPHEWEERFEKWRKDMHLFIGRVGIDKDKVHELEVAPEDRAHYSKRTIDFEFDFPFGRKELYGLAYRTDFDLAAHQTGSGQDLSYYNEETKERFVPHVIEPSFGVERTVLAVLASAYREDEQNGETRVFLKFHPRVAPVKAAVFPLLKNKPELVTRAREIFSALKKEIPQVVWDDNGNIGKRYRRQDEIGTPFCITVDFDTLENGTVTLRDRDSGEQERVAADDLAKIIAEKISAPE